MPRGRPRIYGGLKGLRSRINASYVSNRPNSNRPNTLNSKIRRVIKQQKETKTHCLDLTPTSLVSGTWATFSPDNIPQGDGAGNRDGSQVQAKNLMVRFGLTSPTDRICLVRIMLIKWKNTYSVLSNSDLPTDAYSCIDSEMRAKYSVLSDRVYALNPRTTGAAEDSRVSFHILYKKLNHVLEFDTSATAKPKKGGIYLCVLHGTNYGSGTDDPEIDGECQYNFVEK